MEDTIHSSCWDKHHPFIDVSDAGLRSRGSVGQKSALALTEIKSRCLKVIPVGSQWWLRAFVFGLFLLPERRCPSSEPTVVHGSPRHVTPAPSVGAFPLPPGLPRCPLRRTLAMTLDLPDNPGPSPYFNSPCSFNRPLSCTLTGSPFPGIRTRTPLGAPLFAEHRSLVHVNAQHPPGRPTDRTNLSDVGFAAVPMQGGGGVRRE